MSMCLCFDFEIEIFKWRILKKLFQDLLADHLSLQRELLIKLVCLNESADAFMLAKAFNLNKNQLPDCLRALPPPSDE